MNDPFVKIEVHAFSDASKRAHGCCVYLRFVYTTGKTHVSFLTAKSRVNSLRNYSIPRLKLQGVLLLFQVIFSVINELGKVLQFTNIYCWIDSSVVYSWIQNIDKKYEQFVQNRLKQIRKIKNEINQDVKIKLVDFKSNPADIVSRGMTASNLVASVWVSGPDFLHQSENNWPNLQVGDNFTPPETVCVNNLVPNDTRLSDVVEDKVCDNDLVSDGTRLSDVVGDNVKNHSACGGASMLAPTTYSVNNETCLSHTSH